MQSLRVVECICEKYFISKREIADRIKMGPQNFNQKVSRGTLCIDEFFAILKAVDLKISYVTKENLQPVPCDNNIVMKSKGFADGFFNILDGFGYKAVFTDVNTGETFDCIDSVKKLELTRHHANFKAMHQGKYFNTEHSKIITNDFGDPDIYGEDGIARELYINKVGAYFFAEYKNESNAKNKVRAATKEEAELFIQENGTKFN